MQDRGVGSWIERRARIAPRRIAVISGERSVTYAELAARVRRLAHGLRSLGIQRGDRVAWLGPNHPAFLETLFASAKLGAVLAPLNHRLDPAVLAGVLEDSAPRVAVVEASVADLSLPTVVQQRVLVDAEQKDLGYEALIAESADDLIDEPVDLDDLCMLPYTSGTTGSPKGVMLTHGNITWNVLNLLSGADFLADDVTIAIAPFFRVGGTGVNVLPVMFKGGTVVVPRAADPDDILQLIYRHRVTVGFGNPDLLEALARSPVWDKVDLSSIRFFLSGGAPVPERLIRAYFERGITFVQGYGLSEAAPVVLLLDQDSALRKVGSAGKPLLLVDVRIVRPDGTECPGGTTGEMLVRGPNVMAGYWRLPEVTSQVIDDEGWLRTGDAVRADAEGYIWIVDRMKDAYFSAGEVVYPGDVERVLTQHPSVAEAGVVGVPRDGGRVGQAFIVPVDAHVDSDELLDYSRERLKPHEVPESITIVERLPRNTVGKLLRQELATTPPSALGGM